MSGPEAQTRQEIIDGKLALAGWNVNDPAQVVQELDIYVKRDTGESSTGDTSGHSIADDATPNPYSGHRFADYALMMDGKPVAVVEAKKSSVDARVGQEQARQYALDLQRIHGGPMPLIFYTNGYDTYFWDSDLYPPEKVTGFPTRDDLAWMRQRQETRRPLSEEMINPDIAGRDYQIAAIRSVLEGLENSRRLFLLVMATGTGKTRTTVGLADVLMRARWAQRVLFLVDRVALRDQALEAFEEHMPGEPRWPESGEKRFVRGRRIHVTTFPTMLNLIERGTAPATWISPHYFDLIIADESHRSIYNVYKQVLDYFDAIKLGLTATPTDQVDHDTFNLFERPVHDPTYAYSFEEAIAHEPPYLCDFEVLNADRSSRSKAFTGMSCLR